MLYTTGKDKNIAQDLRNNAKNPKVNKKDSNTKVFILWPT